MLPAVKKDTIFGAAGKRFGTSYFLMALIMIVIKKTMAVLRKSLYEHARLV